jgi:pimeloyl-ACP methyl ester carboxylesterase
VRRLLWSIGLLLLLLVLVPVIALTALRTMSLLREVEGRVSSAPKDGQFVAANDVQLFVQELGPAYGTPVVLVHGPGLWSESWRPTLRALADAGYRVFAIDLPPFGFSFRPPSGDYSTEAQAKRLAAALDSLGLARAIIVAHSLSARPVIEAVLNQPERAAALVLVAPHLGLQVPPGVDPGLLAHVLLGLDPVRNGVVASSVTNPWLTAELVDRVARQPAARAPERVAVLQRPLHLTGTTESVGRWIEQHVMSHENPASRQPLLYKSLKIPTLLLWGAEDPIVPPNEGQHITTLMPAAVLSTLPGLGHVPMLEDERKFNSALLDALGVMAPTPAAAAQAPRIGARLR